MKKWLLGCLAFIVFANASESVCEKLKERDLVQNYLLTELFSNLAEYQHDNYKDIKLRIHIYVKEIETSEDSTTCAFYSRLRFSDIQLTDDEIKSIKTAFAKRGNFATYEENEKYLLTYAKLLKYNNEPLDSILESLDREIWFHSIYKYNGLLQIHAFKMGYLQKDKNAGGYLAPEEAISKGREFLDSKESERLKAWIDNIK